MDIISEVTSGSSILYRLTPEALSLLDRLFDILTIIIILIVVQICINIFRSFRHFGGGF